MFSTPTGRVSCLLFLLLPALLGAGLAQEPPRPFIDAGGPGSESRTGYLCLEAEGSPIEFKNIRIRELP